MEQAASGPASAPTEGDTPRRIAGESESGAGSPVCSFVLGNGGNKQDSGFSQRGAQGPAMTLQQTHDDKMYSQAVTKGIERHTRGQRTGSGRGALF